MKDYVFIGWSRNRDLAIEIKKILDKKGFICVIGGIYEGNPESVRVRKGTVNETINYQMNHCDQAILLFQKIDDNLSISGNLIYELGYINAQYNFIESSTKLHIFKIDITQADDNLFPTDLHGIWGDNINSADKTLEQIANEIAVNFLQNQSQIKKSNKFEILSNHYFVENEMRKHFENPAMSDCDLATNILIYVQAAFCYQEQYDIKQKIEQFRTKMIENVINSAELDLATQYAIQSLTLYCLTIPNEDDWHLSMPGTTFRGLLKNYKEIGEKISDRFQDMEDIPLDKMELDQSFIEENYFESWLIAQMQEHVTYLTLVYLLNEKLDQEELLRYAKLGIEYCEVSIKNLRLLAESAEDAMYADLLLSYAYKNLSTFHAYLNNGEQSRRYQQKSLKMRRDLYSYVKNISTVRPSLKEYITLEYLMQTVEQIELCEDKYEREYYLSEIATFIKQRTNSERNRNYMFNMLLEKYNEIENKT